ncbi:MAG: adenylate/guanylate cyclase domain-containing protein [Acidimicrobiales bacterium]
MGDGPFDLLYCYGLGSHVDMHSDGSSKLGQFLDALASFSRLIFFDRRGTGASDGLARNAMPAWEEWAEDVRAVLDAAGSDRTAIFGGNDAGPIAMMFAALQPERVSALILANTSARYLEADGYPIGMSQAVVDVVVETVGSLWGTEQFSAVVNPGRADDVELARSSRTLRASATPRNAAAQYRYILENLDVRSVLRLIQAPTLVLHSSHDPLVNLDHGRYLADHIPGAKFVEIPGHGHLHDEGELALVVGEIAEFLTGERPVVDVDRVLTTVLFTDIVASTQQLTSVGDRRWRSLLDAHDRAVREQLRRFRGREIKTTGDGFAACFDGPGRAIACATSIIEVTRALGIDVRAGLHTGECEVRGDELAGVAVHLAARIESLASGGEVLVSTTVKDLVAGSGIEFADKGEHQLKGIPATWKLFAVADFGHQRQSGTRDRAPLGRPVRDDR